MGDRPDPLDRGRGGRRSPNARSDAAAAMPGSSSIRRHTGTAPRSSAWRIGTDLGPLAGRGGTAPRAGRVRAADRAHGRGFDEDRLAGALGAALGRGRGAAVEAGELALDDGRRSRGWSWAPSHGRRAGHDGRDGLPYPPLLTSAANPRVRAAAALRERRERDRTGQTLIDGARELRRALDAGSDGRRGIRRASHCWPAPMRGPRWTGSRERGTPIRPTTETVFAKLAFGERAEGLVAVASVPATGLDGLAPAGRSARRGDRGASRSRATWGPYCGARTAPASRRSSRPRPGRTCTARTRSVPAPARSSPSRSPRRRRTRCSPGCATRASGSSPPGSTPSGSTRDIDLTGPIGASSSAREAEGLGGGMDATPASR